MQQHKKNSFKINKQVFGHIKLIFIPIINRDQGAHRKGAGWATLLLCILEFSLNGPVLISNIPQWVISYFQQPLPVSFSEIVGSAKLRHHQHKNKTERNCGEEGHHHCSLLPDHVLIIIFECLLLLRHPYSTIWNRLVKMRFICTKMKIAFTTKTARDLILRER